MYKDNDTVHSEWRQYQDSKILPEASWSQALAWKAWPLRPFMRLSNTLSPLWFHWFSSCARYHREIRVHPRSCWPMWPNSTNVHHGTTLSSLQMCGNSTAVGCWVLALVSLVLMVAFVIGNLWEGRGWAALTLRSFSSNLGYGLTSQGNYIES